MQNRKHNPWFMYLIIFGVTVGIMCSYNAMAGWNHIRYYADGAFIGGAITALIGVLVLLQNEGAFNIFGYQFAKKDPVTKRKPDYYEYMEKQKEKRKGKTYVSFPFFIIGGIFIAFSIITLLAIHAL